MQSQVSTTGWTGKEFRYRDDKDLVIRAWLDGTVHSMMRNLQFNFLFFQKYLSFFISHEMRD